ncbi:hypothetical protein [Chitinophaga rhizosphaerae]|uniref:hypothetical protein n=1 Tax=Chitinophaga rhizosphaerae TaxID=1864947 RepID=UPI000F7FEB6E|nr:hypothetical protein [Chitinophaga rhizosphaerae]
MEVSLRNVEVYDKLSEETIAYFAEVFVDEIRVARATNDGKGGMTSVVAYDANGRTVLKAVQAWLASPEGVAAGGAATAIEDYIDDLLIPHLKEIDKLNFIRDAKSHLENSLVYGRPYEDLRYVSWNQPLQQLLAMKGGSEAVERVIRERIIPKLTDGYVIFSNNLPESITSKFTSAYFFHLQTNESRKRSMRERGPDDGMGKKM